MRAAAAVLVVIALAGCGATMPKRVEIPVPVLCRVAPPARPTWATEGLPVDADIFTKVKIILAERAQRQAYETLLEAAVQACQ